MKDTRGKGETTMTDGHTINSEMVEKVIRNFKSYGREVDAAEIRRIGANFTGNFETATDCVEMFKSVIWNAGLVW